MRSASWSFLTAILLLAGAGFLAACSNHGTAAAEPGKTLGPAPGWTLQDLDGKTVSLSDFKGKVVVLDLWATWCEPCVEELPLFINVQNEWKDKGVTVVGMSIDSIVPADVAKFAAAHGMNYPIVMADQKTAEAYGADQGIPFTLVIDRNGQVVFRNLGQVDKNDLEGAIQKALAD